MTNFNSKHYNYPGTQKQRGAVLLIMLVILVVGATGMLVSSLNSATLLSERNNITAKALAQAKEALIAYAISSESTGTATARPGNFPCPDTDVPGTSNYGSEQASCSAGGGTTIGRLPWKTLGISEPRDADNEPLWYILSDNFRKIAAIINSDTQGTLQVYDKDGTTLLTPAGDEAVAIIIAPGRALGSQQRSSDSDKITASNYLDAALSKINASAIGPFIAASTTESFNDHLLILRVRDFMPAIEKRVARELKIILQAYRAANGYYPYPAPFSSCQDNGSCVSDTSICRGRFPYSANPTMPSLPDWGGVYALPKAGTSDWFVNNRWYRVIYYAVNSNQLQSPPMSMGCGSQLNVSGTNNSVIFFMPGAPLGGITRSYPNNNLGWYLDDAVNTDMNNTYAMPSTTSNDLLYAIP